MVSKVGKNGVHDAKIVHCLMFLNVRMHNFNFKSFIAFYLSLLTILFILHFQFYIFITTLLLSTNDFMDEITIKIQNLLNNLKVLAVVKSR